MQCDDSNVAIGAVLYQEIEDDEHPIVYIHRLLSSAGRNYSTTEKECLALVRSIKKRQPYLEGYKFRAITDHSASRWLQHLKEPIEDRKGAMHRVPDALSRIQEEEMEEVEIAAFQEVKDTWYLKTIKEIQTSPVNYKARPYPGAGDRRGGYLETSHTNRLSRASPWRRPLRSNGRPLGNRENLRENCERILLARKRHQKG